jgi:hypothetical protein
MNSKSNLTSMFSGLGFVGGRAFIAAVAALSIAGIASGSQIGMNFVRGPSGDVVNVANTAPNSLAATDSAGAPGYAQTNWNNLGFMGTNINVLDSSGAASGVVVSWVAGNAWSQSGGGNPITQATGPDANLMNSYLDSNGGANTNMQANMYSTASNNNRNWPLVYFTGLSAWMASQGVTAYDLVIYADGDDTGNARVGEYWTIDASGPPTALVYGADEVSHVFLCDRANFTATLTYAQVPLFVQSGVAAQFGNFPGNNAVFTSLTNDTFLLRTAEYNTRSVINAIQIVPRATAGPASIAPLADVPVFTNGTAQIRAVVGGRTPFTYQWQKNGVNLVNAGNISGANTATLTVANVTTADVANYRLLVTNPNGVATSGPAALSIVAPAPGSYAEKVATNNPYAYWRFNEIVDAATNYAPAYDYTGSYSGIYGNAALNGYNGIAGPQPADFPGFENGNTALLSATNAIRTYMTAPALNLNTNAVTMCAWIYPMTAQGAATGLIFSRNGNDVGGLGYGVNNNIGYTWNSNSAATYNFPSGLVPLTNSWSFVALTVSPTNAILYLYNTNGQLSATNAISHTNQPFSGLTFIGCDAPNSAGTPQGRSFNGAIDEVAVFNRTLPQSEIYNLYKKGLGLTAIAPVIPNQPQSLALMAGRTARFKATATGDAPLTYQWRKNGVNMSNGGNVSGATTPSLTLSNVSIANDTATYDLVVANIAGALASSPATLTVVASNSVPTAYEAKLRAANPISYWRMNEANGSPYSYDYWGGIIATNENVNLGVAGPLPPDYNGFEAGNTAGQYDGASSATDSGAVGLMNNRSQFSIIGWFNASAPVGLRVGLFGQNDVAEFGFHGQDPDSPTGEGILGMWTPGGQVFMSQTNVIPGVWYLIAGVASGTNVNVILLSTNGNGGFQVWCRARPAAPARIMAVRAFPSAWAAAASSTTPVSAATSSRVLLTKWRYSTAPCQ